MFVLRWLKGTYMLLVQPSERSNIRAPNFEQLFPMNWYVYTLQLIYKFYCNLEKLIYLPKNYPLEHILIKTKSMIIYFSLLEII